MILSGKVYTAEELYEIGVVDMLAEDLRGEMAVYDYIRKENRAANGYRALGAAEGPRQSDPYRQMLDLDHKLLTIKISDL